ncbi:hypothetical protein AAVH_13366 [Aphelenchoides avenae]|nr:hypothetical protein AAVH_13366 [Aphelenchus avenae]
MQYCLETRLPDPFDPTIDEVRYAIAGAYWLIFHHFRRDLTYSNVRRFKLPSAEGAATDCALIRRYLSNSYVTDFKSPYSDGRFSLKMLAALVDRNFTVDRLRVGALDGQLTDYRSMDVVFGGGLRMNALSVAISSQSLASLIKTTEFLRLPTVQGLEELKFLPITLSSFSSWTKHLIVMVIVKLLA